MAMISKDTSWKQQSLAFGNEMLDALQQQHYAAQYLALAGRHLIPQKADDSNTNMAYVQSQKLLLGKPLRNDLRLALSIENLVLYLMESESIHLAEIHLVGKTFRQVFDEMAGILSESGIDVSGLKNELHYEIPMHRLAKGAIFKINDHKYFLENTLSRHNAELVLKQAADRNGVTEPIRIWPHHFDSGTFMPMGYNENGELTRSIGLGWAIPDELVDEPYYYLSYWSEGSQADLKGLTPPGEGEWVSSGWTGGILSHSKILESKNPGTQHDKVLTFFTSGMRVLSTQVSG